MSIVAFLIPCHNHAEQVRQGILKQAAHPVGDKTNREEHHTCPGPVLGRMPSLKSFLCAISGLRGLTSWQRSVFRKEILRSAIAVASLVVRSTRLVSGHFMFGVMAKNWLGGAPTGAAPSVCRASFAKTHAARKGITLGWSDGAQLSVGYSAIFTTQVYP